MARTKQNSTDAQYLRLQLSHEVSPGPAHTYVLQRHDDSQQRAVVAARGQHEWAGDAAAGAEPPAQEEELDSVGGRAGRDVLAAVDVAGGPVALGRREVLLRIPIKGGEPRTRRSTRKNLNGMESV